MKLKHTPTDFIVEELTDAVPVSGPFAFYRLRKSGWTTFDAIAELSRAWKVDPRRVSFGGLKDRHAQTTQHIAILNGPKKNWSGRHLNVNYIGQVDQPFHSTHIAANRFTLTLRDLSKTDVKKIRRRLEEVNLTGLPNYFDDQRFGSVTSAEYPARLMVLGRYEEALQLVLTAPYEFDKAAAQRKKQLIRQNWGRWGNCLQAFRRDTDLPVFQHLAHHPHDFRGAVARLRPEMQGLYLGAYQSLIWNRMLASCVRDHCDVEQLAFIRLKTGPAPVPRQMAAEVRTKLLSMMLPLPSARLPMDSDAVWAPWVEAALHDQGHTLHEMKLPGLRKPFFSKGDRPAFVEPVNLSAGDDHDERYADRFKAVLRFELPRGSYATILVKRLTQVRRTDTMSTSSED